MTQANVIGPKWILDNDTKASYWTNDRASTEEDDFSFWIIENEKKKGDSTFKISLSAFIISLEPSRPFFCVRRLFSLNARACNKSFGLFENKTVCAEREIDLSSELMLSPYSENVRWPVVLSQNKQTKIIKKKEKENKKDAAGGQWEAAGYPPGLLFLECVPNLEHLLRISEAYNTTEAKVDKK